MRITREPRTVTVRPVWIDRTGRAHCHTCAREERGTPPFIELTDPLEKADTIRGEVCASCADPFHTIQLKGAVTIEHTEARIF